jgi:PST family polysaccharide transporter
MDDAPRPSLSAHLIRGTAWGIVQVGAQKGCGLVSYLVLAYLLQPADLGAATLAVSITAMLTFVYPGAAGDLVVQRFGDGSTLVAAATRLALLTGAGVMLLTAAVAPAVASWNADGALIGLLVVASSRVLFEGLASVPQAIARSELRFAYLSGVESAMAVLMLCLSVAAAAAGMGPYAIVLAAGLAGAARLAVMAWFRPWAWREPGAGRLARRLWPDFRAGGSQHFLNGVSQNIDYVILSSFAGSAALGLYTIAYQLASMVAVVFSFTVGLVAQPLFTRLVDEPDRLRDAYMDTQAVGLAVSSVSAAAMAVLAPVAIPVMLPERWSSAGWLLSVLALGFGIGSLQPIAQSLMRSQGEYRRVFRLQVVSAVVLGVLVLIGAWLAAAMGVAVAVAAATWINGIVHALVSVPGSSRKPMLARVASGACCAVLAFGPAGLGLLVIASGLMPWAPIGSVPAVVLQVLLVVLGVGVWWLVAGSMQPGLRAVLSQRVLGRP